MSITRGNHSSTAGAPSPSPSPLSGEARREPSGQRKTDKADARWIAELLAHGLIQPSFVPPPAISALRDLTRTRVALIQARTQAKNRMTKVVEDTNIKLASVVADLFGVSGRQMLAALIAGERDLWVLKTHRRENPADEHLCHHAVRRSS